MKTKYRLRKRTDFDGTWWYVEQFKPQSDSWWPMGCFATEERALERFNAVGRAEEEIVREKEV